MHDEEVWEEDEQFEIVHWLRLARMNVVPLESAYLKPLLQQMT